jgi:hypothetical protein
VVASVSGVHGLFIAGSAVFLFGAVTIIRRRGQPLGRAAGDTGDVATEPPVPTIASEL